MQTRRIFRFFSFVFIALPSIVHAEPKVTVEGATSGEFSFRVSARTPRQQAAFFEARHFAPEGIAAIAQTCFLTFGMVNKTSDIVWLELNNWRFTDGESPVKRVSRPQWRELWEKIELPAANRATFDWTQLPETRDLQPDEPVAGNVALIAPSGTFSLEAVFRTGDNRQGAPIRVKVADLRCGEDGSK
jgi:hypothetical protein